MKKKLLFIVFLVFAAATLMSACDVSLMTAMLYANEENSGEEIEKKDAFLHVDGKDFKNELGETVTLKGINIGGWLVQESWMSPLDFDGYFDVMDVFNERFGEEKAEALLDIWEDNWFTETDLDIIKEEGFNSIRVPFTWRNLQKTDYTYKEDAFSRLDWVVKECAEREIYIVLDLHGAHGSQNGRHHSGTTKEAALYSDKDNMKRTKELWVKIAERYVEEQYVAAYDLLNEPEGRPGGTTGAKQNLFHKELYDAIRKVDSKHVIIMEACWEPTQMPSPEAFNFKNVAYEYHFYCWGADNDVERQCRFSDEKVKLLERSYGANIPCYVGEFTYFGKAESWDYALSLYNREGWSFAIWTYKVYGEGSSWGIYTGNSDRVDHNNDSYEEIAEKFSKIATNGEYYKRNDWLADTVKKYLR